MALDKRRKNVDWQLLKDDGNSWPGDAYQMPIAALLMDVRDELQRLNALLQCPNFLGIPTTLRSIRRAMPPQRKAKKS